MAFAGLKILTKAHKDTAVDTMQGMRTSECVCVFMCACACIVSSVYK